MTNAIEEMRNKYKNELCYPLLFPQHNLRTWYEGDLAHLNNDPALSTLSTHGIHVYLLETQTKKLASDHQRIQVEIKTLRTQIESDEFDINIHMGKINALESSYVKIDVQSEIAKAFEMIRKKKSSIQAKTASIELKSETSNKIKTKIASIDSEIKSYISSLNSKMLVYYNW